jgi:anti-anti-sigma factor
MKRAPRWMQLSGTEWLFRLAQEPKRLFKRYANDFAVFGSAIGRQWWLTRGGKRLHAQPNIADTCHSSEMQISCVAELPLPERLDAAEVVMIEQAWMERLDGPEEGIILDGSGTKFIDSTGLGFLMRMQKRCRESGKQLVLAACSTPMRNLLQMTRLHTIFTQAENREAALLRVLSELRDDCQPAHENLVSAPARLSWAGEVIGGSIDGLWRGALGAIHNAADAGSPVVIDLHEVQTVDSGGLGLMVRLKKHATSLHTSLRFTNPSRAVHDSLRHAQLEGWLLAA